MDTWVFAFKAKDRLSLLRLCLLGQQRRHAAEPLRIVVANEGVVVLLDDVAAVDLLNSR